MQSCTPLTSAAKKAPNVLIPSLKKEHPTPQMKPEEEQRHQVRGPNSHPDPIKPEDHGEAGEHRTWRKKKKKKEKRSIFTHEL